MYTEIIEKAMKYDTFFDFVIDQYLENFGLTNKRSICKKIGCEYITLFSWKSRRDGPRKAKIVNALARDFNCTPEEIKIISALFKLKNQQKSQQLGE